jgi:hypothetical protein
MSRQADLAGPICETLSLLLDESRKGDNDTKVLLILQTRPFFEELLAITISSSPHYPTVIGIAHVLMRVVNESMSLFFTDASHSSGLASLLVLLLSSEMGPNLVADFSNFMLSLMFSDFSSTAGRDSFFELVRLFFSNPVFPPFFQASGGLFSIWDILLSAEKVKLCDCVLLGLSKTIHCYFQSDSSPDAQNFLSHVSRTIADLPECSAPNAFQFIFDLISNGKGDLLSLFIQMGGFVEINRYIQKKNDPQFLIVYQMFRSLCTVNEGDVELPPVMAQLVDLIQLPDISGQIRAAAMTSLANAVRQFSGNPPLQPHHLYPLAVGLDGPSAAIFLDMCLFLATHFPFEIATIMPALIRLFTVTNALENDFSSLFQIFRLLGHNFAPFSVTFYGPLMQQATPSQVAALALRYPEFLRLVPICFQEGGVSQKALFEKLVRAATEIEDQQAIGQTLFGIVTEPGMYEMVIAECICSAHDPPRLAFLMGVVIEACLSSAYFRKAIVNIGFLDLVGKLTQLKPTQLFNVLAALAGGHFNPTLDAIVAPYLKRSDYLGQDEAAILRLTFGLQQHADGPGRLCYPSLLHKCGTFEITSEFDLWVCAQYGIGGWMRETGRPIAEFPQILKVARRFATPEQVRLLFEHPSLFAQACTGSAGVVPLFEFAHNLPDQRLKLPIGPPEVSISFWLFFADCPPTVQDVCAVHAIHVRAHNDSLRVNNERLGELPLKRWCHICISIADRWRAVVYVDGVVRAQLVGASQPELIFGAERRNQADWYIGGVIRIFNVALRQQKVEEIVKEGVEAEIIREGTKIAPSDFVESFGGLRESPSLSENSRPVPAFPLVRHIAAAYNGNQGLFARTLDLLQEGRIDDGRAFLTALCHVFAAGLSGWSRAGLALHVSALIHICPTLFDLPIFEVIVRTFVGTGDTFDWFAFLTIIRDFGLLSSPLRSFVISTLFGYVAQFPPVGARSKLGLLLFEAVHVIDFTAEERESVIGLLIRLELKRELIERMLASLPGFADVVLVPTLRYGIAHDSPLFGPFVDLLEMHIDATFPDAFIYSLLPPARALGLIHAIVTRHSTNERFALLPFCLSNCHLPKAWSSALTLLTGSVIDVELDLEFRVDRIDARALTPVLLMLAILAPIVVGMNGNNFWAELWRKVISLLTEAIEKLPIGVIAEELQQGIVQLLNFGMFQPLAALFPFSPSTTIGQEILDAALRPGQPFVIERPLPAPFLPLEEVATSAQLAERVRGVLTSVLPPRMKILPGVRVDTPTDEFFELCLPAVVANRQELWADWPAFLTNVRGRFDSPAADISSIVESNEFSSVVKFAAAILVRTHDAPIFSGLLTRFLIGPSFAVPVISLALMRGISCELLEGLTSRHLFSPSLISFLSERVREGWFGSELLDPVSFMLGLCESCEKTPPEALANLLVDIFQLILEDDLPTYLGLFVRYGRNIWTIGDIGFYVLVLDRLISRFSLRPQVISEILSGLCAALSANKEIALKWVKSVLPSCPDCEMAAVLDGVGQLAGGGLEKYSSWIADRQMFDLDFKKLRMKEQMRLDESQRTDLLSLLAKLAADRARETTSCHIYTSQVLALLHDDLTVARATAACIRQFHRDHLLLSFAYFFRTREVLLTGQYRLSMKQSRLKALSVLSDPIFPSRRLESSPLLYEVPPFPGGRTDSYLPPMPEIEELLPLLPAAIRALVATPFAYFRDFAPRSPRQLKLAFSLQLPLSDAMRLSLLELVLNEGRHFDRLWDVSFLYGAEPLPGLLLQTPSQFLFLAGMRATERGVADSPVAMSRILQSFYMAYLVAGHWGLPLLFEGRPVVRWPIAELLTATPRFWLHKLSSIELNFIAGWHFILIPAAGCLKDLSALLRRLADESIARFARPSPFLSPLNSAHLLRGQDTTRLWINGALDNFTYLCICNRRGLRSLADYTQYYVFPWIIADYNTSQLESAPPESFRDLALPMGQIGVERAKRFDSVFAESDFSYLYGTHYMHFGVVLYFLFRLDPFCLFSLHLHRGWDHRNRLFYNVYESWVSAAYTSPSDVKELVPEFFCVPEMFENPGGLPLTTTTEGRDVERVDLGTFCRNPHDFVHKMRHFLQGEHVSQHLPSWIDLVFGCKSRGDGAVKAKNLFHPLCYVTHDDTEQIESDDQIEREAAVTSVINFGQCCHQAFTGPHPPRARRFGRDHLMTDPALLIHQRLNAAGLPAGEVRPRGPDVVAAAINGALLPTGDLSVKEGGIFANGHLIKCDLLGTPSAVATSPDGVWLAVGQREGGLLVWLLAYDNGEVTGWTPMGRFLTSGSVGLCAISPEHFVVLAVCGSVIDRVELGTRSAISPIDTGFVVTCIAIDDQAALVIAGGQQTLAVWTMSGTSFARAVTETPVLSIAVSRLPETAENRFFATGHANGAVKFWVVSFETMSIVTLHSIRPTTGPITRIGIGEGAERAIVMTDGEMFCLDYRGSPAPNLKNKYAIECGECASPFGKAGSLLQNVKVCANCHRFLCQNCLPAEILRRVERIKEDPTSAKFKMLCPQCWSVRRYSREAE